MKTILIIMLLSVSEEESTIHHIEFDSMQTCETAKERTIKAMDMRYDSGYFVYCVEK